MKTFAVSILMISLLAQTFSRFAMQLNYFANADAYAKNCENKAKPAMGCKGKCQVMKKIKEEEKKDQQVPGRKFADNEQVLSSRSFFCSIITPPLILNKANGSGLQADLQDRSFAFFHPPQL